MRESWLRDIGFRVVSCGIMVRGPVTLVGPPASGNQSLWRWLVDDQPLPQRLFPKTEAHVMILLGLCGE